MFLPGIRQTVHLERKKRTVKTRFTCPEAIGDDDNIPQGELFAEALTDARYKSMLIDYISVSFPLLAKSQHLDAVIIIDSQTYGVEYVSIDQGCAILSQLPEFSELVTKKQAWPSLLAVYLLSGSDYISGFFRISHDFMVKVFLKYLRDIISDETLIKTDQSGKFKGLSENTVIRFISFVYLEKHIKLFSHLYSDAAQL